MFDFDDIENPDDVEKEEVEQETPEEIARRAARGLERSEWKVRWDSCRELAKLGTAAAPYIHLLEDVAEREKDNDVRKAAASALEALREAGVEGSGASAGDPAEAEQAAANLDSLDFSVRRNACRTLGRLGELAAPYFSALRRLADSEKDYEVRQAARDAVRKLRSAGVEVEEEGAHAAKGGPSSGAAEAAEWWPKALFQVLGETLPMRLEREGMTPFEITEIWEKTWGIQYAGRVRFAAPEDSDARWLRAREDIVPRTPFVVRLEANSGTLLQALAGGLQLYGRMSQEEVFADRTRKLEEQTQAAEKRAVADAKEDARYLAMDHRRRWRQVEEVAQDTPSVKRVLGRSKLGCG